MDPPGVILVVLERADTLVAPAVLGVVVDASRERVQARIDRHQRATSFAVLPGVGHALAIGAHNVSVLRHGASGLGSRCHACRASPLARRVEGAVGGFGVLLSFPAPDPDQGAEDDAHGDDDANGNAYGGSRRQATGRAARSARVSTGGGWRDGDRLYGPTRCEGLYASARRLEKENWSAIVFPLQWRNSRKSRASASHHDERVCIILVP